MTNDRLRDYICEPGKVLYNLLSNDDYRRLIDAAGMPFGHGSIFSAQVGRDICRRILLMCAHVRARDNIMRDFSTYKK
jgi:hypothetical protein